MNSISKEGPNAKGRSEPVQSGIEGRCRWCDAEVKPPRRVYCDDECSRAMDWWEMEHRYWNNIRNRIIRRDGFTCRRCGYNYLLHEEAYLEERRRLSGLSMRERYVANNVWTFEPTAAGRYLDLLSEELRPLEVHHIKPRLLGGDDSDENLITLCRRCHDLPETHAAITEAKRQARREAAGILALEGLE